MAGDIAKTKRNIQKMMDQGASDTEIDSYIADEGLTLDQIKSGPGLIERAANTWMDAAKGAADVVTRGFLDKSLGPQAQAETAAGQERLGPAKYAVNIPYAVASSPWGLGGKLAAGGLGAVEGGLSAYGHQKNWVPDWQGVKDIGKGAAIGGGLGLGFGALGEQVGKWFSKTDVPGTVAPAAERQATNIERLYNATGGDRDQFAKALASVGYDASQFTRAPVQETLQKAGDLMSGSGNPLVKGGLSLLTGGKSTAVGAGLQAAANFMAPGSKISQQEIDAALSAIRTPTGGSTITDPATVDRMRNAFAKMGIGYGRSP